MKNHSRIDEEPFKLDHHIALWTTDAPYDIKGQFWNLSTERTLIHEIGQGSVVKTYQQPHPPIVITAVEPFSGGVTAAARGWEPISANFLLLQWVKSHWGPNAPSILRDFLV